MLRDGSPNTLQTRRYAKLIAQTANVCASTPISERGHAPVRGIV
jgi:hypothetical protein